MVPPFSIIIPVRIDCIERKVNLETVLNWCNLLNVPIYLLEADKDSNLSFMEIKYKNVQYIFIYDDNSIFHRTKYINILLQKANTDIIAIWDADIIVPYAQITKSVNMIRELDYTIIYPYDGKIKMIAQKESNEFRKNPIIEKIEHLNLPPLLGRKSCGGIFIINKNKYCAIGGENEKYIGWGPEDAERLRRAIIMEHKVKWLESGFAYHLYHPSSVRNYKSPSLTIMRKEFIKECSMNKTEMTTYIQDKLKPMLFPDNP